MRPVITDFSAGELSPRLAGRIDLPLYFRGAKEMTNFLPAPLGGVSKRGGLILKALAGNHSSKNRLIPWSVNNDIDLMVVLSDKAIRFLDVSGGKDPSYLTSDGSTVYSITKLDTAGLINAYSEADIAKVKYAQNGNQLVIVHKGYRPFFIRFDSISGVTLSLSYGIFAISGNVAKNVPASIDDEGKTVSPAELRDAMLDVLSSGVSYATDSNPVNSFVYVSGVKKTVTAVKLTITYSASYLKFYQSNGTETTITDVSTPYNGGKVIVPDDPFLVGRGKSFQSTGGMTYSDFLKGFREKVGAGKSAQGTVYQQSSPPYTNPKRQKFEMYEVPYSYNIELTYSGGTLNIGTANDVYVQCALNIPSKAVVINGAVVGGSNVFDMVAPWLKKGVQYSCDYAGKTETCDLFNGAKPVSVRKMSKSDGEEYLEVVYDASSSDTGLVRSVTRSTRGITGTLRVVVTPFYLSGDNPSSVCFHQGRLCLASGSSVYMSKPNDHSNFQYFDEIEFNVVSMKPADEWTSPTVPETRTDVDMTQQVGAGSAIKLEIATDENEEIQWMVSAGDLIIGTATTEWVVPKESTAMNARAIQTSRNGSADMQARFVGDSVVFPSRSARVVRSYTPGSAVIAPDITQYAEHMNKAGITAFDFRQDPFTEVFFVLADGTATRLRLTPTPDGLVPAWSRIRTRTGDVIESVAVIAASDEDAVYFVVRRTVNGSTLRLIERLQTVDEDDFMKMGLLDCGQVRQADGSGYVSHALLSSSYGYGVGNTVSVAVRPNGTTELRTGVATVANVGGAGEFNSYIDDETGLSVAIPASAWVWMGYPYTARLETFRIDNQDTEGLEKSGGRMHLRVYKTGKFDIVRAFESPETTYRPVWPVTSAGVEIVPYTGRISVEHDAPYGTDQSVVLQSSAPVPVNILTIAPTYSVGGSA